MTDRKPGRPKIGDERLHIVIDETLLARVDEAAKVCKRTRSAFVREALRAAVLQVAKREGPHG